MAYTQGALTAQTLFLGGKPMIGAKVYIFDAGTTTPRTVYKDHTGQAAHPRPFLTDANGMVPVYYVGEGYYRIRVLTPANVPFLDMDNVQGAIADSGSGPGPGPTPTPTDSAIQTGDIIAAYSTGPRPGWTACNGGTIGQAMSGASNVAVGAPSSEAQPDGSAYYLFKQLWEKDDQLPVYSAGIKIPRGATAVADWDANRTIGVPDLRGRGLMGLDAMGATAANVIQVATTITTTAGNADAVIGSTTGVCVGMVVIASGLLDNTKITKIEGSTVTLSSLPTSSASGAQARLSIFGDAQKLGRMGGTASHVLSVGEIPEHDHKVEGETQDADGHQHSGQTDLQGGHFHSVGVQAVKAEIIATGSAGVVAGGGTITSTNGQHIHNFVTALAGIHKHIIRFISGLTGKGGPHNNLSPATLITFYIKL